MALGAIRQRMPPRQREEFMWNKCTAPTAWLVTPLAVGHPTIGEVIWIGCPCQIRLMANFALGRCAPKLPGGGPFVATLASGNGMNTHQREAGACMLGNQPDGFPYDLAMATLALQSERRRVGIDMTPGAAARHIGLHRPAVVVAPQAGRSGMGSFQWVARFRHMVERKVGT